MSDTDKYAKLRKLHPSSKYGGICEFYGAYDLLADLDAANARIKELEWACPCRNCAGCSDETKCTPWLTWDEHKTAAAREAVKR